MKILDRPDGASASAGSTVAASAVVICAVFLVALPPAIAIVSMFDPRAFDQAYLWLQRLWPVMSFLDYIKAAVTVVSLAVFWKSRQTWTRERAVVPPDLGQVLAGEHRVGVLQRLGGVEAQASRLLR